ncbi:MAG: PLP-dependent transferase [Microbacteriaceae bacterium]
MESTLAAQSGGPAPSPGFATAQIHAGHVPDSDHGARIAPVYLSNGFVFADFDEARARFDGDDDGFTYTRMGNPTNAAVERKLAALEGGVEAVVVASGQAAVTTAVLAVLKAGDHLVSARSIYEGTRGLFRDNLARLGIEVDFVDDADDPDAWRGLVRPTTRAFFGESIPNPRNDLLDIPAVAAVAHEAGVPLIVDNTLATPYLLRPIEHGADIVVHSTSKFLSGHGSSVGGVVIDSGRFDWTANRRRFSHLTDADAALGGDTWVGRYGSRALAQYARTAVAARLGPTLAPFNAFLLQQGIETLSLRVERHSANARAIAEWLERHPQVESVDYSGLASNPSHALAQRLLPRGQGSVFAFTLRGGHAAARAFVDAVGLFSRMTHLGDVRSLVLHPASTSHQQQSAEELRRAGIGQGTLRLSVGIEDLPDLLDDLEQALAAAREAAVDPDEDSGFAATAHTHLLRHAAVS